jgi:FkbM family methyltransferase
MKNFIIQRINSFLFNYKKPVYRTFLFHLARRYVDFFKGEHNSNMETNGEYRLLDLIFKKRDIKVVFDVGANRGDYAEHILAYNKKISLYCFEPDTATYKKLKETVGNRVVTENVALADASGVKDMFINTDAPELNSFHDMEQKGYAMEKVTVKVDTLDQYCSRNNIQHIDLLKVDTEGHELFVFRGGKELFKNKAVELIQFEFGNASIYSKVFFRDVFDFFVSNGYVVYKVMPQRLEKVVYGPECEKVMYANFIALKEGVALE